MSVCMMYVAGHKEQLLHYSEHGFCVTLNVVSCATLHFTVALL